MRESDGRIDIAFTAVTYEEVQGTVLHDIPVGDIERTLLTTSRAHLHAVRAIAPYMIEQRNGVIQTMVGYGPPHPLMGSTALASLDEGTALGQLPSVKDAGAFAAFAASPASRSLTATGFNMTSGAVSD